MNFKNWLEGRSLSVGNMPEDAENYIITKEINGYHVYFFDRINYNLDKNNRETQKHNNNLDHEESSRKQSFNEIIEKLKNLDVTSIVMEHVELLKKGWGFPKEYKNFLILLEKNTPISQLSSDAKEFFLTVVLGNDDFYGFFTAIFDTIYINQNTFDIFARIKQVSLIPSEVGILTWFTEELPKQINSNIQKVIAEFQKELEVKPVLNYKKTSWLSKVGKVAGNVIRQGMNFDFKSTVEKHVPLVERVINAFNAIGISEMAKFPIWLSYQFTPVDNSVSGIVGGTFDYKKANVFITPFMGKSEIINILAHELGHSVYATLSKPQKLTIQKLAHTSPAPSAYGSVDYKFTKNKGAHESGDEWMAEMIALIALNPAGNWNILHKIKGTLIPGYAQKMQTAGNEIRNMIPTATGYFN